jgi:hypothetical protein
LYMTTLLYFMWYFHRAKLFVTEVVVVVVELAAFRPTDELVEDNKVILCYSLRHHHYLRRRVQ